jgi:hypothetical protein
VPTRLPRELPPALDPPLGRGHPFRAASARGKLRTASAAAGATGNTVRIAGATGNTVRIGGGATLRLTALRRGHPGAAAVPRSPRVTRTSSGATTEVWMTETVKIQFLNNSAGWSLVAGLHSTTPSASGTC